MIKDGKMNYGGGDMAISMAGAQSLDDAVKQQAVLSFNKEIAAREKLITEQTNREIEEGKRMQAKADKMEIVPCNNYVLVRPYAKNPFEKLDITESGIVLTAPEHSMINPNTGEKEEMVNFSVQADVIEVGPLVKWVKEGDIVYYRRNCGVPIPFFRQGFEVVAENQIQVFINEGIKERIKKMNENDGK